MGPSYRQNQKEPHRMTHRTDTVSLAARRMSLICAVGARFAPPPPPSFPAFRDLTTNPRHLLFRPSLPHQPMRRCQPRRDWQPSWPVPLPARQISYPSLLANPAMLAVAFGGPMCWDVPTGNVDIATVCGSLPRKLNTSDDILSSLLPVA